jgi:hypothetical protein
MFISIFLFILIELYISSMAGPEAFEEEPSHSRDVHQLTRAIPLTLPFSNAKGMIQDLSPPAMACPFTCGWWA